MHEPLPADRNDSFRTKGSLAPTRIRFRVLGWLFLASVLGYLCRNAVGVAEKTIRTDLGLSKFESGWVMSAFFWSYALLQVPVGWLGQIRGTRSTLTICAVVWGLGSILFGLAPGFLLLLIAQLLMGAAQAGVFPCAVQSISSWMPKARRASACSVLPVGMQIGAIFAASLTGFLISGELPEMLPGLLSGLPELVGIPAGGISWRWVFLSYGLVTLLWSLLFLAWFRNRPEEHPKVNAAELQLIVFSDGISPGDATADSDPTSREPDRIPWKQILTSRSCWFLCLQQAGRAAGSMFFASWFPTFLQKTRGVSTTEAGYLQSLVFMGTLLGSLIGGQVLDWVLKVTGSLKLSRQGVGVSALVICSALILAAYLTTTPEMAVALICIGVFFSALTGPCAYVSAIDLGGKHVPQIFGLMNMTGNLAAATCPVLVAWYFERNELWEPVLIGFAVVYLLSGLAWVGIDFRHSITESPAELP